MLRSSLSSAGRGRWPATMNTFFPSSFCSEIQMDSNNGSGAGFQSSNGKVKIFDRDLKRKQRDRAAWLMGPKDGFVDSVAENLLDRLEIWRLSGRSTGQHVRPIGRLSVTRSMWRTSWPL